jgi:hypothetical protein
MNIELSISGRVFESIIIDNLKQIKPNNLISSKYVLV